MTALVVVSEFFKFIIGLIQDIFAGFLGILSPDAGAEDATAE